MTERKAAMVCAELNAKRQDETALMVEKPESSCPLNGGVIMRRACALMHRYIGCFQ